MRRMRRRLWRRSFRRRCLRASSGEDTARRSRPVQFRRARRQEDRGDVFRHVELARDVPSGAVEQEHGMGAVGDIARDFVEMKLHHVGVRVGQAREPLRRRERGRSRRTDRRCRSAGRRAALAAFHAWPIGGQGRSSGRSGPHPGTRSRPALSPAALRDEPSARAEVFLNPSTIRSS